MARKQKPDVDNKYLKIKVKALDMAIETLARLKRIECDVGIFDAEVAKYGSKMEYGGPNSDGTYTPPRSFLRSAVNENRKKIISQMAKSIRKKYDARGGASAITFSEIISTMSEGGEKLVNSMKKKIWSHIPPPLSQRRLAEKKAAKYAFPEVPLVATGTLVNSITFKIRRLNPEEEGKKN